MGADSEASFRPIIEAPQVPDLIEQGYLVKAKSTRR